MTTNTHNKNRFIKLPTGDLLSKDLIGSVSHYGDHGVMLLNTKGEKLLWIPQSDNAKAVELRDFIVGNLLA
ncbi:hypothetical protein ABVD54_004167 [Vibrio parahaemolyticus]|nr:hypothetical protein [Vibrio parahaemolyticus]